MELKVVVVFNIILELMVMARVSVLRGGGGGGSSVTNRKGG